MTFNQYSYPLKRWINNVTKNKTNDEILLLVFREVSIRQKPLFKKLIKHFVDLNMLNYKILDIEDVTNINDVELNSNVILLGHFNMDINKIKNSSKTILFHLVFDTNLSFFTAKYLNSISSQEIGTMYRYLVFIEQRNPIEIIKTFDYSTIRGHLFYLFLMQSGSLNICLFSDMKILQSNKTTPFNLWQDDLEQDLIILCKYKILTSRLAVALYRAVTLKFSDSNTKIGKYYNEKLKVKSTTVRLPKIQPQQVVKAYKITDKSTY